MRFFNSQTAVVGTTMTAQTVPSLFFSAQAKHGHEQTLEMIVIDYEGCTVTEKKDCNKGDENPCTTNNNKLAVARGNRFPLDYIYFG